MKKSSIGKNNKGHNMEQFLNRKAAIPLYHQIFLTLRDEITCGSRAYGSSMPTEMELMAQYKVSRITTRRALDELANVGLVKRRRRTGTTVVFRHPDKHIEAHIDQAVESLIAFGQNTAVEVLEISNEPASSAVAAKLGIAEGEMVVRAVRLRSAKNQPLGLIISHLPADLANDSILNRLTRKPILSLLQEANVTIGGAVQTIEAIEADPELAASLAVEPRAAILHVERQIEDEKGSPVLVTNAYYRGDRYRITLDVHEQSQFKATFT